MTFLSIKDPASAMHRMFERAEIRQLVHLSRLRQGCPGNNSGGAVCSYLSPQAGLNRHRTMHVDNFLGIARLARFQTSARCIQATPLGKIDGAPFPSLRLRVVI
jgi:hypothetical protein